MLPEGFSVLHGSVVHCLPDGMTFDDPVYLSFELPQEVTTLSGTNRILVYYSPTDVGTTPMWRTFRRTLDTKKKSSGLGEKFIEDSDVVSGQSNEAKLIPERSQLVLALRHFCVFAVVVDGRQEQVQKASIQAFLKMCVSSRSFTVDVLVLVGCDEKELVSKETDLYSRCDDKV